MANYLVTDSQLVSVADAIRAKTGSQEGLAFPDAFVSAIGGIETGGGEDRSGEIIDRTISGIYSNSIISHIGNYVFYYCSNLTTISCPNVKTIGERAFNDCRNLSSIFLPSVISISSAGFMSCTALVQVEFPSCITIGSRAFYGCQLLNQISFPACTSISPSAFYGCQNLTTISFPSVTYIGPNAFYNCGFLESVYLFGSSVPSLGSSNTFGMSPIGTTVNEITGSIYVPASLYSDYLAANIWSNYAARFVSLTAEEIAALNT